MSDSLKHPANYRRIPGTDGNRYRFFCDISGALICETGPYREESSQKELELAWNREGALMANQCHRCGRWVIDAMYNADVLHCVDCAPWEDKPNFCPECGKQVKKTDTYCSDCGAKLWYGKIPEWNK